MLGPSLVQSIGFHQIQAKGRREERGGRRRWAEEGKGKERVEG